LFLSIIWLVCLGFVGFHCLVSCYMNSLLTWRELPLSLCQSVQDAFPLDSSIGFLSNPASCSILFPIWIHIASLKHWHQSECWQYGMGIRFKQDALNWDDRKGSNEWNHWLWSLIVH
jgi:hypothetical protein